MTNWNEWMNKKVFIKLREGYIYSGEVVEVNNDLSPIVFITIIDKFGERVQINNSDIIRIQEFRK